MAGDLILLTGGTGHLGFSALRFALENGYNVRAAVRSGAKAEAVRSNPTIEALNLSSGQLTFAIVPDITSSTAYDEAVVGVKYIIHIASPLSDASPNEDYETNIIQPAIRGTLNVLEAARKAKGIERIVITSSVVAITPLKSFTEPGAEGGPISAEQRIPETKGPYKHPFAGYHQSKVAALNRAEAWIRENKPAFDAIYIHPSYIEGRNDMNTTLEDFQRGTNRLVVNVAIGKKAELPTASNTNFVDDTALIHVKALDPKIPGNSSYLVTSSGTDGQEWNQVRDIVARKFPDAVKKGILSTDGELGSYGVKYDIGKTEEVFGIKLASFETQVVSVLEQYIEVWNKVNGTT